MSSIKLRFNLPLCLLLGMILFSPLKLLGAEQTDPSTQPTVPPEQPTVPPEQPAVPPEQPAVPPEQPAVPPEQPAVPPEQQAVPPTKQTIPSTQKTDRFDSMEAPRNYLSGKIASFADDIDRFFGGDRHYQESNSSVIDLSLAKRAGYGGERKLDISVRLNLRLPVTEGRLRLLVETDPEKNITEGPTPAKGNEVLPEKTAAPKGVAVAVRLAAAEENIWHFSTDAGVKFPIPLQPFVRTRASFSTPMGDEWRLKAAESLYWFNNLGTGATTLLDFEHVISAPFLFRASSNITWLNAKNNYDMHQDLSLYHTLNDRTVLLYQASAIAVTNPQFHVTDYVLLLFYRYRMHREWLFFELSPQLHFPSEKKYQLNTALTARLEILFDESR